MFSSKFFGSGSVYLEPDDFLPDPSISIYAGFCAILKFSANIFLELSLSEELSLEISYKSF